MLQRRVLPTSPVWAATALPASMLRQATTGGWCSLAIRDLHAGASPHGVVWQLRGQGPYLRPCPRACSLYGAVSKKVVLTAKEES